jgi:hypothetical protein
MYLQPRLAFEDGSPAFSVRSTVIVMHGLDGLPDSVKVVGAGLICPDMGQEPSPAG